MNTSGNKRRKESIEKIESVFMDMLKSKDLSQIYVSDICKKTGLNRTTFYANYTDIHDLADSIRRRLETNLAQLYQKEREEGYNSNDYLKLFRNIYENQEIYSTYFKLGFDDDVRIVAYDTALSKKYFGDKHINYHMEFFRAGITRIIKIWLSNGCRESPEEMFGIIRSEYQGRELFLPCEGRGRNG